MGRTGRESQLYYLLWSAVKALPDQSRFKAFKVDLYF